MATTKKEELLMNTNSEENQNVSQGIPIFIDRKPFKASKSPMTGAELRTLPEPDIGNDRDLWLDIPGPGDDDRIELSESVRLKPGMHFYTAPSTINPGASDYGLTKR